MRSASFRTPILVLLLLALASCATTAISPPKADLLPRNADPLVLVYGLGGFGRDEGLGLRYWGGMVDLQERLQTEGFEVVTPAVGSVSSNWDRACELYAALKGGIVDYGEAHSRRYGHHRYGREYTGLLPTWGLPDPATGIPSKAGFFCHSMGGTTVRLLAALLERGSEEERAAGVDVSPLFSGGKRWIRAVTTLCSPHDGVSQVDFVPYDQAGFRRLLAELISLGAATNGKVFDFKLDQWDLKPHEGEGRAEFAARVLADRNWQDSEDGSFHDVSPEGAGELNRLAPAMGDIYYFSWAADTTSAGPKGTRKVSPWVNLAFLPSALFMASYVRNGSPEKIRIDRSWWPNDGVVNTRSMPGPSLDSQDTILPWTGRASVGSWNFLGTLQGIDHLDVIGFGSPPNVAPPGFASLLDFYRWNASLLRSLPGEI